MVAADPTFNIADFQKGSPGAISHIFGLYYRPLVYFADSIVNNRNEAEDIVVDAFMKLMKKTTDFDTLQNIKSFLFVVTRNACYNYLQYLKVDARSQKELQYLHDPAEGHESDYAMMDAEIIAAILEEVENLPPQCRQVFKYLFFQRMTTQEIADTMGISVKTVRNQKARAIQLLQTFLLKKNLLSAVLFLQVLFSPGKEVHS